MDDGEESHPACGDSVNIGKSSRLPFFVAGFATAKQPPEYISEHRGVSERGVL
jgi:hypothetical protein